MRQQIKRKLRSNQGMTLLLSLLVFLVCVVAGSVALTAGTATSGTLSERAKLDQRYFSVTSAAELIRERFKEKSVRVRLENNIPVKEVKHGENDEDWITREKTPKAEERFVIDQSVYLLNTQFEDDPDWQQFPFQTDTLTNDADNWLKTYAVTVESDAEDTRGLNATVTVSRERPENLNFIVKSAIPRKDPKDPEDPSKTKIENETFGLNVKYNASILKTGEGANTTYYVKWEIGTISYAN